MRRICVFCGANPGRDPGYRQAAAATGTALARAGIGVVYGGAGVGLMGAVADAALAAGGEVIGIIPRSLLEREVAHRGAVNLRVVESMHERKALMADLADGFITLPGGIGTLEEFFEVWSWAHLGLHRKPCALLDTAGFYRGLAGFLDHVDGEGFLRSGVREMLLVDDDVARLLERMRSYRGPDVPVVLTRETR